jgi:acetyl esterase/lipase
MRLKLTLAALPLLLAVPAFGQTAPPPGAFRFAELAAPDQKDAIPLYAGVAPGSDPAALPEQWLSINGDAVVRNVTRPTITAYLPDPKKATGAAVIVAPGGAYYMLAMQIEGWNVAQWLADRGIAAFVLKYRVDATPRSLPEMQATIGRRMGDLLSRPRTVGDVPVAYFPPAVADAQAAIRLIRARSGEWGIDPDRIGMIGFSAGAMTALAATLANDPAARPAFTGAIYPPMNSAEVPADAAPLFVAIAADDGLFGGRGFGLVQSWQAAKRPVELHYYEKGDHGFGVGKPGTTSAAVMDQFRLWLETRGLLKPAK